MRNNYLHDGHVRGILLKSSDCRIENNRIERIALNGIVLKPEFFWLEVPMPRDRFTAAVNAIELTVTGNVIDHCNAGPGIVIANCRGLKSETISSSVRFPMA